MLAIDLAALDTPEGKAALTDILLYHVVSGEVPASAVTDCMSANAVNGQPLAFTVDGGVMVNDATVSIADVNTSNGVIHVIDTVLTPTDSPNDIPRTAQCTGIHNSLVSAVVQAELLETLQGAGPFTLFAPTDQAFADAGIDLAALDTPEGKAALTDILLYHVVAGEVPSSAVSECLTATTVNGNPISFTVGDGVMVNDRNGHPCRCEHEQRCHPCHRHRVDPNLYAQRHPAHRSMHRHPQLVGRWCHPSRIVANTAN